MRWGRTPNRKQEEENLSTDQKNKNNNKNKKKNNSSLLDLLSFSWLSKLRSKTKTHNNPSPKSPSFKPKFGSKNSPQRSPFRVSNHDQNQPIVPRRRSVGDIEDRPVINRHTRHRSVGGAGHVCYASLMTLGHAIPFSVVPRRNKNPPPRPPFCQNVPDPGLYIYPRKIQRKRKIKTRLVVTSSGNNMRRRSFNGKKTQIRRYKRGLEKFAVVKRSSEPERDFKKSMVEMILETGIRRSEELESLLACYLALNADEHYDVIVKVFRQVCFEINRKEIGGRL